MAHVHTMIDIATGKLVMLNVENTGAMRLVGVKEIPEPMVGHFNILKQRLVENGINPCEDIKEH